MKKLFHLSGFVFLCGCFFINTGLFRASIVFAQAPANETPVYANPPIELSSSLGQEIGPFTLTDRWRPNPDLYADKPDIDASNPTRILRQHSSGEGLYYVMAFGIIAPLVIAGTIWLAYYNAHSNDLSAASGANLGFSF